ncbi:MAG: diguanylate cyclase [Thermoanaerobaculia bacterium]
MRGSVEDRLRHELEVLSRLARSLVTATRLDDLVIDIVNAVGDVLEFDDCVLYLWDEVQRRLVQRAAHGPKHDADRRGIINPLKLALGEGIVGAVAASRLVEIVDDVTIDRRYVPDLEPGGSELAVPILHQNTLLGVIDAESRRRNAFTTEDAIVLTRFADLCASSIVNVQHLERETRRVEDALRTSEARLKHLASHDSLTGLVQRRRFEEELAAALISRSAGGAPSALIRITLDRFHQVNDQLGPARGDALLQRVASEIKARARRSDVAARIAGVDFALLARGATVAEAATTALDLLAVVRSLDAGATRLTASAGVVALDDPTERPVAVLERADRALALAETGGGDRVEIE